MRKRREQAGSDEGKREDSRHEKSNVPCLLQGHGEPEASLLVFPQQHGQNQKVSVVLIVRAFMTQACEQRLSPTLGFCRWSDYLGSMSKTITTANFYLRNVYQFFQCMRETPPPLCRLSKAQLTAVVRDVKGSLSNIMLLQIQVKAKKMSKVMSKETLKRCRVSVHHNGQFSLFSLVLCAENLCYVFPHQTPTKSSSTVERCRKVMVSISQPHR